MALRPDIVLQRSINAALAGASNVTDDTDLTVPEYATGASVDAALNAVKDGIGSGFRFIGKRNGVEFLRVRFAGTLVVDTDNDVITLPSTYTTETILDTTLNGVLVGRIESSNGAFYLEGSLGTSGTDFIFDGNVVAADGVSFGTIELSFNIPTTPPATGTAANGVWMQAATIPTITNAMLIEWASHDIYDIYYECGWPTPAQAGITNGSIPAGMQGLFPPSASWVADVKARMAAISPKFRLWAWFGTFASGDDATGHLNARVNLLDSTMRAAAISTMMAVVNLGFDGVADDTEDTTEITTGGQMAAGTVSWNNEFAAAAQAAGKLFMAYLPANWSLFNSTYLPQITGPDFLYLAAPGNGDGNWATQVQQFFDNAPKPVIMGVAAWTQSETQSTFSNLSGIIGSVSADIDGYGIYLYPNIASYWLEWDNWRSAHPVA